MSTAFLNETAPGIDPTIAPDDAMYCGSWGNDIALAHYAESGRSALQCIRAALAAAGKDSSTVHRILDLPCGHGRVLRVLKAAYPRAKLTACDIDRSGVDFCARQFGAEPAYSSENPAKIPLTGPFDLIWCGSLLTHLDAPRWSGFLARFRELLAPDGVCVFTAHGIGAVHQITIGKVTYGISDPKKLLKNYTRNGFAYMPYDRNGPYGISMSSPPWVVGQIGRLNDTRLVLFVEKGWHDHHDVIAFGPLFRPGMSRPDS